MKEPRFAKFVVALNLAVPGVILLWDVLQGNAGANPVNYAIRTSGMLSLICLCLTLTITPLRKTYGFRSLFHFRRVLGLSAFFYALAHFAIFYLFDRAMDLGDTFSEMVKRPYLMVGSVGLLVMAPLAATSTNAMIKRLGPKRWALLHRLTYVAVVAGVIHYYMLVKSDVRLPVIFIAVVAALFASRIRFWVAARGKARPATDTTRWSGHLRVGRIVRETPTVKTFRLVPGDRGTELPFAYLPGQYLTFTLLIGRKKVKRSYTIASAPSTPGCCEVTIKREPMGLVSRHMHDAVREGDLLEVSAPSGRFTFTGENADRIALLGAGVGITPLMSILRELASRRWPGRIDLIFSCKSADEIIFRRELEELRESMPNLHLTITLTQTIPDGWDGAVGRIDYRMIRRLIPEHTEVPYFLCGPSEMLRHTQTLLRGIGVADSNIYLESFGSVSSGGAGETYPIEFSKSGQTAEWSSNRPLIGLAEQLGIEIDSECRSGICGRCKCRLGSGTVEMDTEDALDEFEKRDGIILLCQARPCSNVSIEL